MDRLVAGLALSVPSLAHATAACADGTHPSSLFVFPLPTLLFAMGFFVSRRPWRSARGGWPRRMFAAFVLTFASLVALVALGLLSMSAPCVA